MSKSAWLCESINKSAIRKCLKMLSYEGLYIEIKI